MTRCHICGATVPTYRVAAGDDHRRTPTGMAVIATGAEHYAKHGCPADHKPTGR